MQIHQINCQYLPEEDRLLLRINTTEKLEHQYLITRRYLKLILKAFNDYFKSFESARQPTARPEVQKAISEFEHQRALQTAELEKPFEEQPKANVAELLYSLQVDIKKGKNITLKLFTKNKEGIELAMPNEMAHSFFHLLSQTVVIAEWDMDLYFPVKDPLQENRTLH